jgi:hypothetical protein
MAIIDEIGSAPLDDTATELPFRLIAAAHEHPIPRGVGFP